MKGTAQIKNENWELEEKYQKFNLVSLTGRII